MSELADAWQRITAWLTAYAPVTAATLQPGAAPEEVDAAEAALGVTFTVELREWFTVQGGVGYNGNGMVLPSTFLPLSADEAVRSARMMREVWADLVAEGEFDHPDQDEVASAAADEAGTVTGMWIDAFVPVADDCGGDLLFVDTRPGALHGCVTEYMEGDSDTHGPTAPTLTAVVADVARSLTTGTITQVGVVAFVPKVVDGVLEWEIDDEESQRREAAAQARLASAVEAGETW